MIVERRPITELKVAAYNPRETLQPGDPAYEALVESMTRFGVVEPLVWNRRTGNLVSGHQRLRVLQARWVTHVEVSVVDVDDAEERALNLALNKVQGRWDNEKLQDLLAGLETMPLDWTGTGFTAEELAKLTPVAPVVPLFTPPSPGAGMAAPVTAAQVEAAQKSHDTRWVGHMKILDVTCPHCGGIFGLSEGAVDGVVRAQEPTA